MTISEAMKLKWNDPVFRKRTAKKISQSVKKRYQEDPTYRFRATDPMHTKEAVDKMRKTKTGVKSHRKGITLEQEYGKEKASRIRKKCSDNARWKGKIPPSLKKAQSFSPVSQKGNKNMNWKEDVQNEYGYEFTNVLKRKVRKRDNNECQYCFKQNYKLGELVVHHIDENKLNNELNNLISLCRSCHKKIHHSLIKLPSLNAVNSGNISMRQSRAKLFLREGVETRHGAFHYEKKG